MRLLSNYRRRVDGALQGESKHKNLGKYRGWFIEAFLIIVFWSSIDDGFTDAFVANVLWCALFVSFLCVTFTHSFTRRLLATLWTRARPRLIEAKDRQLERARNAAGRAAT